MIRAKKTFWHTRRYQLSSRRIWLSYERVPSGPHTLLLHCTNYDNLVELAEIICINYLTKKYQSSAPWAPTTRHTVQHQSNEIKCCMTSQVVVPGRIKLTLVLLQDPTCFSCAKITVFITIPIVLPST